jgi:hypothetical protein
MKGAVEITDSKFENNYPPTPQTIKPMFWSDSKSMDLVVDEEALFEQHERLYMHDEAIEDEVGLPIRAMSAPLWQHCFIL